MKPDQRHPSTARQRSRLALISAAAALAASAPAQAIDAVWLGGDGNWTANNWSSGGFPATALYRAVIDGGGLTASSVLYNIDGELSGLRIGALDQVTIADRRMALVGDVSNDGVLLLFRGRLQLDAAVRFSGAGRILLTDSDSNAISSSAGSLLSIAAGQTLAGGGHLGSTSYGLLLGGLHNQGEIVASQSMGLNTGGASFRNEGLVQVDRVLTARAPINNLGGRIQLAANATLALVDGTLDGGTLQGGSGSQLWGGRVSNLVIAGSVAVPVGQTLQMSGYIQNAGELVVRGEAFTGNRAVLQLNAGATTFSGSGNTVLAYGFNSIVRSNATSPLTLAAGHTLRGSGRLGAGGADSLFGGLLNLGTVRAETDLGIGVDTGGAAFSNLGRVEIANNSLLAMANGTELAGGVVQGSGYAQLRGALRDTTLQGSLVVNQGGNVRLAGVVRNEGTLTVSATSGSLFAVVELAGATTLGGGGQTVLGNEARNVVFSGAGSLLTVDAGHTLRGAGSLGSVESSFLRGGLLNRGTLSAEGSSGMAIDTGGEGSVLNQGLMTVAAGSSLTVRGAPLLQNDASALLDVAGSLFATSGVALAQGRLQGSGRVVGDVLVGNATLGPGNSPGVLLIEGQLQLQDGATLAIEADGLVQGSTHDWLQVSGGTALDGTLSLVIGYAAAVGDSFRFLSGSAVVGTFDTVLSTGYELTLTYGSNFVTATVAGISPVPEPAAWALWLGGLAGLAARARRRHAQCFTSSKGNP